MFSGPVRRTRKCANRLGLVAQTSFSKSSAPIRRNRKFTNRLELPFQKGFSMVSGVLRWSRRLANRVGLPGKQTVSQVSFCHRGCALRGIGVRAGARMFSPFHGGLYCRALQQWIRVAFARRRASLNGINFRSADGHPNARTLQIMIFWCVWDVRSTRPFLVRPRGAPRCHVGRGSNAQRGPIGSWPRKSASR